MSKTSPQNSETTSRGSATSGADAPSDVADALSTLDDGADAGSRSVESRGASPIVAPLLATQVSLGPEFYQPSLNWFRAFVPTGSRNRIIFGTLAETRGVGHATLFCGARNFNGRDGILVTIFAISPPSVPRPNVIVTLLQAGATQYGEPVPYTGL